MENFPDEILVYIFSFLSASARKRIGFVCKRWHEIIWNTKSLSKNNWFTITHANSSDLCSLQRDLSCIIVKDMQSLKSLSFWEAKGSKVIALELNLVFVTSPILYEILRYCPNLIYLTLSDIAEDYLPYSFAKDFVVPSIDLSNVLHLRLLFTADATISFIPKLTEKIRKLKELDINVSRNILFGSLYCDMAFDVLSLIQKNSRTLTKVKLTNCPFINPTVVFSYLEAVGPQLIGLYLSRNALPDSLFGYIPISIASKFKNLVELDLSYNSIGCESNGIVELIESLKQLKRLDLRSTDITDEVLYGLCQFEQLQSLDLSNCQCLTSNGVSVAFFKNKLINLLDLRLSYLQVITDDVLKIIMPKLSNLTRLYLNNCRNISSAGVGVVVENCKFLGELSFLFCYNITDLVSINISGLEWLTSLDLHGCSNVTERSVFEFKFCKLVKIDLTDIIISKESLLALINNCLNLQRINMSHFPFENDVNFRQSVNKQGCVYPILVFGSRPFAEKPIFD